VTLLREPKVKKPSKVTRGRKQSKQAEESEAS
jgi:hypothetical protein